MTAKLAKHWLTMIRGTCVPILPVTWLRDGLVWVLSLTFMGFYFNEQWPSLYQCHEFFVIRHIMVHMICYLQWTSLAGFLWKGNSTNPQYRLTSRHLAQSPFPNRFSPFSLHLSLYTHKPGERQLSSKLTSPSLIERLHGSCPTPLSPSLSLKRSKHFALSQLKYGFAWPEPNTWQFFRWFCYHPSWLWALL